MRLFPVTLPADLFHRLTIALSDFRISSKAVAVGALMLAIGGGSVVVDRQDRDFQTWSTNFVTLVKVLGGFASIFVTMLPVFLSSNSN